MIDGETVRSGAADPGTEMEVLSSAAGYYYGYLDKDDMPYSRESGYFRTYEEAERAMLNSEGIRS